MVKWSQIVESFPLTVRDVIQDYIKIPADASNVLYHYTTHAGLEGILRSGGLRATYRMRMSDTEEFRHAKNIIYETLDEVGRRYDLPKVAESLTRYTRINLGNLLRESIELSRAYCACLTVSPDHPQQWETYAEESKGFAIGFDFLHLLPAQVSKVQSGHPYLICAPVTYDERKQRELVLRLVEAGIRDMQTFVATCSKLSKDLTAFRNRVTLEIVVSLLTLIDFMKAPIYSSEREMRVILDPNDGTLKASKIEYFERGNESIPFVFMDLCNPRTKRLSLAEINVGPKASFLKEKAFLEDLLDELGYGRNYNDRPRIIQALLAAS